ncbi:helix-turn-helix domain-containing protein [Enterococcus alcedinis]|uniref:Mga helix-turn-helix domain-containing protein n=1 Tax=Enterococcus alcedinis TaxID=1274384 RepID=A0A917N5P2_9ENTE|nr:helix-turn-helix domain-containing protein [Enterococcus alcedinis]MBP2100790.1 hypothetical protein [Enterococcus alcedinis]GGI64912.1 hypothetical protein GCM10011482_05660 [Enterococcus alcedinis]
MINGQMTLVAPLGLDRDFLLKSHLLQVLDNAHDFLTTSEIAKQIPQFSIDVIQQTCRMLKEDLHVFFPEPACEFIISKRSGIRLIRRNVTLKQLINHYAQQDLSFILIQKLFLHREIVSIDFYEEHHISESTLRRKVRSINATINNYDIHITFAQKIKLTGSEFAIRSFYFSFLFLLYRQLSSLPLLDEQGFFESRSLKILDYLETSLTLREFDIFALVYYTYEQGVYAGIPLQLSEKEKYLFQQFHFPPKPPFLNNWSLIEWQFFLLFLYSSELLHYNFKVSLKDSAFNEVLDDSTNWVHAFQQTFHPLTVRQQQAVFHSISKYITLSHFVFMRDEIFFLFRIVNYSHLEQAAPNYYKRFLVFWKTFCQKSPHLDTNLFRLKSFTLMTYFSPLVAPLAPVTIAIYSEFAGFLSKYLSDRLTIHFQAFYQLTFVDSFLDADLIISTTPLHPDELLGTPAIIVEPTLNIADLLLIQDKIQVIVNERTE